MCIKLCVCVCVFVCVRAVHECVFACENIVHIPWKSSMQLLFLLFLDTFLRYFCCSCEGTLHFNCPCLILKTHYVLLGMNSTSGVNFEEGKLDFFPCLSLLFFG